MATYTVASFSIDNRRPGQLGSQPFAIASGTISINPYSQTPIAITQINGLFKTSGLLRVIADGVSSGGFHVRWDPATRAFRLYQSLTAAADTELSEGNTNGGTFGWIAFGQMG